MTTLDVDDDVLDAAWNLEQRWAQRAQTSSRPDATGPTLKRLAESVLRVAGLLAIERAPIMQPCITLDDFAAAQAMGERWVTSTVQVLEALGASDFQREAERVADTVRRQPDGVSISNLYRAHRRLRKRDFDEILAALEAQDVIRRVEVPSGTGRPPIMFRAGRRIT